MVTFKQFLQESAKLKVGQRVLWFDYAADDDIPGKITSIGQKNGKTVYGVKLDKGEDRDRWGYEDEFTLNESRNPKDVSESDMSFVVPKK